VISDAFSAVILFLNSNLPFRDIDVLLPSMHALEDIFKKKRKEKEL